MSDWMLDWEGFCALVMERLWVENRQPLRPLLCDGGGGRPRWYNIQE